MAINNDGLKEAIVRAFTTSSIRNYYEQEYGGDLGTINSSGWTSNRCPFPGHTDTSASFGFNLFAREPIGGYKCHGCGKTGDIFTYHMEIHGTDFPETLKYFADFLGVDSTKKYKKSSKKKKPLGKPDKIYQYTLNGKVVHETLRYSNPKTFRQRVPDKSQKSGYKWTLAGTKTVPYNADELIKSENCFIVEGERDAESLKEINLVATSNPMGAGKWPDHINEYFKNKNVVILPDNDEAGRNHAKLVSNKLYNMTKSIKIVALPGLSEGGDVTDWLEKGNTKETLLKLIEDNKPYQNHIDWLNSKHAVIMLGSKCLILTEGIDPIFDRPTVTFPALADLYTWYGNRKIPNPNAGQKGQHKEISIVTDWIKSPERRSYEGIIFDPNKNANGLYNLWRGFAFEPKKGDWSLLQNHIKEIIVSNSEFYYKWLITWLARIVQDPGGRRPGTAIVLKGDQGVGKGMFLSNFGKLFSPHYFQANNQKHLTGRFNGHLKDVLFLFVDEGFWAGDKSSEGIIKGLITEDTLSIEQKGRDAFTIKNNINLALASNNDWVVPAGLFERRFCVFNVSTKYQQNIKYFEAIRRQLENGGYEAMLYDLLKWDLASANIREIPRTGALFSQTLRSMDPFKKFWFEKLREGILDYEKYNYDEWLEDRKFEIETYRLRKQYEIFCDERGTRFKDSDSEIGIALKEICPQRERKRGQEIIARNGLKERPWIYVFPRLQICRDLFEKRMGKIEYMWDEDKVFSDGKFEDM